MRLNWPRRLLSIETGLAGMAVNGSTAGCRPVNTRFSVIPFQSLFSTVLGEPHEERRKNHQHPERPSGWGIVRRRPVPHPRRNVCGQGLKRLAEKALHESEHERQHALAIIQRILFLEGTPDMSKRSQLKIGRTVPEMLQSDLDYEYHVVGELKKAMAACEKAQDYVTRDMLAVQLEDTEMDHAYYLEKQLRLIELVGLKNYQQSQIDSGNPA
jgi:bacterioferritin